MNPTKAALAFLVLMLGLFSISVVVVSLAERSVSELPVIAQLPEFELVERSGVPVTRESLLGRVTIVDFFFTRCPDACPVMSENMAELHRSFDGSNEVLLVSISVDPENDTLPVLSNYAERHDADENWWFLRGDDEAEIVELSEKGFLLSAQDLPLGHATRLVLVDAEGNIRGYYDGLDEAGVKMLKTAVRRLVRG